MRQVIQRFTLDMNAKYWGLSKDGIDAVRPMRGFPCATKAVPHAEPVEGRCLVVQADTREVSRHEMGVS
jgi:hypothetical protein